LPAGAGDLAERLNHTRRRRVEAVDAARRARNGDPAASNRRASERSDGRHENQERGDIGNDARRRR
jgi:hypothetical protein